MSAELILDSLSVSEMDNNCYLVVAGDEAMLIDAASNPDALMELAAKHRATITTVVTTHRHGDHVGALAEILQRTGARHVSSSLDAPALPCDVDEELDHGDTLSFAGHEIPVFILRGHTPGGLCLELTIDGDTHLIVGDSLFPGGVGKTNSKEDFARLITDVKERVFDVYPPEAHVHPGHGDSTTVGAEAPHLEEWCERGW